MKVVVLGNSEDMAYKMAENLINEKLGFIEIVQGLDECDLAIAPLLTEILSIDKIKLPEIGVLVFHPSPLPFGRGKNSIKFAYKRNDPVSAATWFWANNRVDAGDICEQEVVKIDYSKRPRDFYNDDILPAMLRTLERALLSISAGIIRKIPQVEEFSSYD
jgi:formyltetrahydrofolate dehydrogenase